jgi:hypothetical protein
MKWTDQDAKKYTFTLSIYSEFRENTPRILEVYPVLIGMNDVVFIEPLEFERIANWHNELCNHSPMMCQSWISEVIDRWEEYSNWQLYDTKEEASLAALAMLNQEVELDCEYHEHD